MSATGQVMAACAQSNVGGSWQVYSFSYQRGFEPYWVRRALQIKPNGVFENTNSNCVSSTGIASPVFGCIRLIGTQACIFDGYSYANGVRSSVNRATMNRAKDHLDGAGCCYDNAPMESFFHALKVELVHQRRWTVWDEARRDLFAYIEGDYIRQRIHSALGYITPGHAERKAS